MRPERRWARWVAAMTVIAAGHALLVATRYHVGSFDDDAGYIMAARALASGSGLTATLPAGYPLVGAYPPGYAALLTPLALIWHHGFVAFRALSLAAYVGVFPLTCLYLGRRRVAPPLRVAVLGLLALSPVLATYATMVMPETVFVVDALALLLVVESWADQRRILTWQGVAAVACAGSLLWLKEAGIGLVIGVAGWLLLRRLWRKALIAGAVPAALFLPVVIARARAHVALIGSRYSGDLTGAYHGSVAGHLGHLGHAVPGAAWAYVENALPQSIVPTQVSPLPLNGPISGLLAVLQWTAAPLVVVGFIVWCRRHGGAACVAVPAYVLTTLVYPFTNERRVILVLPVVVAWYAVGAATVAHQLRNWTGADGRTALRNAEAALAVIAASTALVAIVAQFPRDYLYSVGQDSSSPDGSAYLAFLRRAGAETDVVETGYLWTTALFSGHRTANAAYLSPCQADAIDRAIRRDRAGYLLTAALNRPDQVDSPCVLGIAAARPGTVRLYRTGRDRASVFELVGPGTAHPDLRDLTPDAALTAGAPVTELDEAPQTPGDPAGRYLSLPATGGAATLTWSWPRPARVAQVSLGAAAAAATTGSVTVGLRAADGSWHTAASAPGAVGEHAATHFLIVAVADPEPVTALRITVAGAGTVTAHDIHAIGSDA